MVYRPVDGPWHHSLTWERLLGNLCISFIYKQSHLISHLGGPDILSLRLKSPLTVFKSLQRLLTCLYTALRAYCLYSPPRVRFTLCLCGVHRMNRNMSKKPPPTVWRQLEDVCYCWVFWKLQCKSQDHNFFISLPITVFIKFWCMVQLCLSTAAGQFVVGTDYYED